MMSTERLDCGSGVRLERAVRCTMPDGVTLVSDHYYPPAPGPHPTLLMRQPYGRDIASTVVYAHPVWFAAHGYNVVIQDVRGRGDSEGEFYPFRNEGADGAETIRWLRTRSESNGSVGMYGFSYQGLTQLLAAAEQPEGLVCIAPAQTACDLYHGWFYRQGALRLASSLGWGLQMLKADARRLKLRAASDGLEKAWADLRSQPLVTPYGLHPQLQHEGLPSYVHDWFTHDLPGPYWSALDVSESLKRIARARTAHLRLVRYFPIGQRGRLSGHGRTCGQSISRRRTLGSYPVGRAGRRAEPWPRSVARYRFAAVALVQPLAQGQRRVCPRAAHPPLRLRR